MSCYSCGEDSFIEVDGARTVCTQCGTVLEESAIVSEITFGETSGGAAMVQGSYVGADQTRVKTASGYKTGGKQESREQTMLNGRRRMQELGHALRLPERLADAGARYFNLAVNMNFVQGRRTIYVIAACLYSACRMDKTSHMLIDFSDLLEINVFVLGSTYLKLVKELSLQLPTVDPSLYISRFAALLEFGDETQKVAQDAVRLVARMGRDWMHIGRRPAGVCGACLLLAARMNNFRRTIPEIVQVVKIGDFTLRKRLQEFKDTPSGALTVDDFRTLWLDETADPPSFSEAQKREKKQREAKKKKKKLLRSMKDGAEGSGDEMDEDGKSQFDGESEAGRDAFAELAGQENIVTRDELYRDNDDDEVEPSSEAGVPTEGENVPMQEQEGDMPPPPVPSAKSRGKRKQRANDDEDEEEDSARLEDPNLDQVIEDEMGTTLQSGKVQEITNELDQRDAKRIQAAAAMTNLNTSDRLDDLDEEELDAFILTDEEVQSKSRLWMEINKDYLKQLADKQTGPDGELKPVTARRPRKRNRPRDSNNAQGLTAADSTKQLLSKKRFSKKVNYSAIESLFGKSSARCSAAGSTAGSDDESEAGSSVRGDDEENEAGHVIGQTYRPSRGATPIATKRGQPIDIPPSPWSTPRDRSRSRSRSATPFGRTSRMGSEAASTPAMSTRGLPSEQDELARMMAARNVQEEEYFDEV